MSIFGKTAREYVRFARIGMILIVVMGVIRFVVGISGVPYERATHLVSMTILTLVLFVVYGYKAAMSAFGTYRHLLPTAAALSISMYGFIVLAILTEGLTPRLFSRSLASCTERAASSRNAGHDPDIDERADTYRGPAFCSDSYHFPGLGPGQPGFSALA